MANQEEIEKRIQEQRTIEANKKNLVGQNGKIGTVLKVFGQPIISQSEGGSYIDTNYIDTTGTLEETEPNNSQELMKKIPIMDLDGNNRPTSEEWAEMEEPVGFATSTLGWHFDGLSRGMHMEIKYDDLRSELLLSYKGYPAYKETKGEIVCYVPNQEWEKWIDLLYKTAKEVRRRQQEEKFEQDIRQSEKNKSEWWRSMVSKWGFQ